MFAQTKGLRAGPAPLTLVSLGGHQYQGTPMPRLAARSLADISLEEDAYKADFEIAEKYQAFSSELVRLCLLGDCGFRVSVRQSSSQERPSGRSFLALAQRQPPVAARRNSLPRTRDRRSLGTPILLD